MNKIMKNKKLKGYSTLKEARAIARERASLSPYSYSVELIYLESDGSYSVGKPNDKKAVFVVAIDKSGAKYKKVWENIYGKKVEVFEKIEKIERINVYG